MDIRQALPGHGSVARRSWQAQRRYGMHAERNSSQGKTRKQMDQCWRRLTVGGWLFLLTLALSSGFAQETPSEEKSKPSAAKEARASTLNPAKEADIRRLLELTGAKKNAMEFGQQLGEYLKAMLQKSLPEGEHSPQIGDTLISNLMARLSSDEMIVRLIPIYDKAFSGEELKGIIRFYESAAGQRLLEATPQVMEEANNVSEKWVQELIPQIMEQMAEQFPELKQSEK